MSKASHIIKVPKANADARIGEVLEMKTINLSNICGTEVLSRANVRKLYEYIDNSTETVDMSDVTFISRSVADELCNLCKEFTHLSLIGLSDSVDTMLRIVIKGRSMKREYATKAKVSTTFNCRTMDDLRNALLSH